MKNIKILVACGSGVATSTVAALKIKEICKELGIEATVEHTNLNQVKFIADNYDLVCTTSNFTGELNTRFLNIVSFITGIKEELKKEELRTILKELSE